MLCDLGSVGDTTKADFFLGELFDFPGGAFSQMCCNFHLGYVGKIDEYVSDKFFKNQKLDLDNFTHFHNFNL